MSLWDNLKSGEWRCRDGVVRHISECDDEEVKKAAIFLRGISWKMTRHTSRLSEAVGIELKKRDLEHLNPYLATTCSFLGCERKALYRVGKGAKMLLACRQHKDIVEQRTREVTNFRDRFAAIKGREIDNLEKQELRRMRLHNAKDPRRNERKRK